MVDKNIEKRKECDENMAKIMTQIDLIIKYVMGVGSKTVNAIGISSCMRLDEEKFETMCNKEVKFMSNLTDELEAS